MPKRLTESLPRRKPVGTTTTKNRQPYRPGGLSRKKLTLLRALAKASRPVTRDEIGEVTGIKENWIYVMGAPTAGRPAPGTLEGDGLIVSEKEEGTRRLYYTITTLGRERLALAERIIREANGGN